MQFHLCVCLKWCAPKVSRFFVRWSRGTKTLGKRLVLAYDLRESFQGFSSCSYCQANRCEENPKLNASVKITNENSNCMAL